MNLQMEKNSEKWLGNKKLIGKCVVPFCSFLGWGKKKKKRFPNNIVGDTGENTDQFYYQTIANSSFLAKRISRNAHESHKSRGYVRNAFKNDSSSVVSETSSVCNQRHVFLSALRWNKKKKKKKKKKSSHFSHVPKFHSNCICVKCNILENQWMWFKGTMEKN